MLEQAQITRQLYSLEIGRGCPSLVLDKSTLLSAKLQSLCRLTHSSSSSFETFVCNYGLKRQKSQVGLNLFLVSGKTLINRERELLLRQHVILREINILPYDTIRHFRANARDEIQIRLCFPKQHNAFSLLRLIFQKFVFGSRL
jgi:hypothetical protein